MYKKLFPIQKLVHLFLFFFFLILLLFSYSSSRAETLQSSGYAVIGGVSSFGSTGQSTDYQINSIGGQVLDDLGTTLTGRELGSGEHYELLANLPKIASLTISTISALGIHLVVDFADNPSDTRYEVALSDDSWVTSHYVQSGGTFATGEAWLLDSDLGGDNGLEISGFEAGTRYCFKVRALHGDFTGTRWSQEACVLTPLNGCYVDLGVADVLDMGGLVVGVLHSLEHIVSIGCSSSVPYVFSLSEEASGFSNGLTSFDDITTVSTYPITADMASCASNVGCYGIKVSQEVPNQSVICDSSFEGNLYSGLSTSGLQVCLATGVQQTLDVENIHIDYAVLPKENSTGGIYTNIIYYTFSPQF